MTDEVKDELETHAHRDSSARLSLIDPHRSSTMPSIKEYNDKLTSLKNTTQDDQDHEDGLGQQAASGPGCPAAVQRVRRTSSTSSSPGWPRRWTPPSIPCSCRGSRKRTCCWWCCTSDRGLCGGFNNGIIRKAEAWLAGTPRRLRADRPLLLRPPRLHPFPRPRELVQAYYEGATARRRLSTRPAGSAETVIAPVHRRRVRRGVPGLQRVQQRAQPDPDGAASCCPSTATEFLEGGEPIHQDYIFEPDQQLLLERLLPRTLYFTIYYALLENAAGEHGARMTAMDNATNNATA